MEKRHFALLEDGRLNNFEKLSIQGGGTMICKSSGSIIYTSNGETSACPIRYKSCNGLSDKLVCNAADGYNGPTGPAGLY